MHIQSNRDKIVDWCELWGVKINVNKTVAVSLLFTPRMRSEDALVHVLIGPIFSL